MTSSTSRIENSDLVTSWFGYWPSFHDAEVVEMAFARYGADGNPSLSACIHAFQMTKELTADGYFVCRKHALVTLLFEGLDGVELDGFNHQNALSQLTISERENDSQGRLKVCFAGAYGLESEITCQSIRVVSVVPGIPPGSVYSRYGTGDA